MSTTPPIEPLVKKPREIEIITCHCGSIIAGTVLPLSPEWGDEWNRSKADYIKEGYTVSVVANAQLASCRCKDLIAELRAERAELIRQRDEAVTELRNIANAKLPAEAKGRPMKTLRSIECGIYCEERKRA